MEAGRSLAESNALGGSSSFITASAETGSNLESGLHPDVKVNVSRIQKGEKLGKDVAVVMLVGMTGSGKSSFVEKLASKTTTGPIINDISSRGMDAGTLGVTAYRLVHTNLNIWTTKDVILVDTPGFADKKLPESKILTEMKGWMKQTRVKGVDLILYFDRISDRRMSGTKHKSMQMFKALFDWRNRDTNTSQKE